MTPTPPDVKSIFGRALEIESTAGRAAYLDEACGPDADLRAEVEGLLANLGRAGEFMRRPAAAVAAGITGAYEPLTEGPGTHVGPYKLLQQIGEGGMGVVYMAEQERPVRRKVALKIIKPGMDSKQVVARFEAERQALAMMDHTNIARVFDAGTTATGRPYFVMELVHGVPITRFCDDNKLTPRERLELFVPVCQAIQHAHHKGIIHRDIKPSNVLVTMYDDKPVPKVIDFGVAKAVEQRLTEKTLFTQFGVLVGTFEYMSPEQAEMNAFGVDTRSDIYALGVLLYELLTGTTPLERKRLREAAFDELRRIIKEEEPQRPSVRLSTSATRAKVAEARKTEPAKLSRLMRGELDWVVMKCLEKDRSRRYDSASGLAKDVERYLKDEPVEACPPSLTYRISKVARRNRGLLTTAAAFVTVLIVGAAISIWQAVTATQAERRATLARQEAEKAFKDADLARQEAVEAKEKVESASRRLNTATLLANEGFALHLQEHRTAALQKYHEAADHEEKLWMIYLNRRMLYTELGLWDLAAADYAKSFGLAPWNNAQTHFEHALLQAFVGNQSGYREACHEFVRQYRDTTNNDNVKNLLLACTLLSEPVMERPELIRSADALAISTAFPRLAAAMAYLRAGDFQRTNEMCKVVLADLSKKAGESPRLVYGIQAIALHKLGSKEEANQSLNKMGAAIDELTKELLSKPVTDTSVSWTSWLLLLHWHQQAHTQLYSSPPPSDPRLATLRERGIEVTKGDVYFHMAAARKAVERKAWDEAAASFATAIDKMPLSIPNGPGGRSLRMEMVQQAEVFEKLVTQRPQWDLCFNRGHILAGRRDWPQAAKFYARGIERFVEYAKSPENQTRMAKGSARNPNPLPFFLLNLAGAKLLAGDEKGYLEICERIQRDADRIEGGTNTHHASRLLSLSAADGIDRAAAVRLSEKAILLDPKLTWFIYGLGLAHYRAGDYEKAMTKLDEHLKMGSDWVGIGQDYAVLAMTCHRLNRPDDAREWLKKAMAALAHLETTMEKARVTFGDGAYMNNWFELMILLREAEKLIESDKK